MSNQEIRFLTLSPETVPSFAAATKEYLPAELTQGSKYEKAIFTEILRLDDFGGPLVCRARHQKMGLNVDEKAFRERILLSEIVDEIDRVVVAGLRFRNLDKNFPFIEIRANFRLTDPQVLSQLKNLAIQSFAGIAIKGLTFREVPGLKIPTLQAWSHVVYGKIQGIPELKVPSDFNLEWPNDFSYYGSYLSAYRDWQSEKPEISKFVKPEEKSDLQEAAKNGKLANLIDEKSWAGVIAGVERPLFGAKAIYIFELFLSQRQRGKKLSKNLEAEFIHKMGQQYDYIWGHIHSLNQPSLRTALALGRKIIETEYFLPFG